ncbi:MAG: NADH:quinone oxidoreductase [Albidovulum sp.]
MSDIAKAECRRNSWMIAAAGGILVALMLLFMAQFGFFMSLVAGLIFCVLLGMFLVWAFCTGSDVSVAQPAAPVHAAPRPAPTAPAPAAPAAAAVAPAAAVAATPAAAMSTPAAVAKDEAATAPRKPAAKKPAAKASAPKKSTTKAAAKPAKAASKPAAKAEPVSAASAQPASADGLGAAMAKSKTTPKVADTAEMLKAPRGGKADDLKMIKGVGPALEKVMNTIGVWHFDQIASWKARDIAEVDSKMVGFHGRITRDGWVKQAKLLAKGEQTEFSKRVSKGDVY